MIILPAFNEPLRETAGRLYEFYGPWDFLRLGLRFCYAKAADRVNGTAPITRPYSARDVALRHQIPIYEPENVNASSFVQTLEDELVPDLLVSVAASQIFKRPVLEIPRHGCINLHSAPLPRYQGMMPNFWTMVHQEPQGTVTIHYMVEKLDAGDMILQRPVPIEPNDSLHDLMVRSKVIGIEALDEAIDQIAAGTVRPKPLDPAQATYFSFPKREDAIRLRALGRRLL